MRRILLDSSSAILLYKVDLLADLLTYYQTFITPSIFRELTGTPYDGSSTMRQYVVSGKITVMDEKPRAALGENKENGLRSLNIGERDLIRLFFAGDHDFIIIDDGKAAKFCIKHRIPFINALLVPKILGFADIIDKAQTAEQTAQLAQFGWYSSRIIQIAAQLTDSDLKKFLPET